jgi:hypothetical protein
MPIAALLHELELLGWTACRNVEINVRRAARATAAVELAVVASVEKADFASLLDERIARAKQIEATRRINGGSTRPKVQGLLLRSSLGCHLFLTEGSEGFDRSRSV